ncbi:hypothetical protein KZ844_33910 [Pseudomonas aeruginosa]|nr:hypothetical protein [Pseudomonas aeruginosa]
MSWQRLLGPLDRLPTEGSLEDWHAAALALSLIHISEPTRHLRNSYAVFCLKKKK